MRDLKLNIVVHILFTMLLNTKIPPSAYQLVNENMCDNLFTDGTSHEQVAPHIFIFIFMKGKLYLTIDF